jgi:hypothetical protein
MDETSGQQLVAGGVMPQVHLTPDPNQQALIGMHLEQTEPCPDGFTAWDLDYLLRSLSAERSEFTLSSECRTFVRMVTDWFKRDDMPALVRHLWQAHVVNHRLWDQLEQARVRHGYNSIPESKRAANAETILKAEIESLKRKLQESEHNASHMRYMWLKECREYRGGVPLNCCELSVRTRTRLDDIGCETLEAVAKHTESDLLRAPGFGRKSLNEVKEVLGHFDLKLAEPPPEPEPEKPRPVLDERDALALRDRADGRIFRDIGKSAGVSTSRARVLVYRALRRLGRMNYRFPPSVKLSKRQYDAIADMMRP